MRARIEQELALLRQQYGEVEHAEVAGEDWFKLSRYRMPEGWQIGDSVTTEIPIAFLIKADYPGSPPYGFLAPAGLNFKGTTPGSTGGPPKPPPFEGNWLHFSWSVENWAATSDVTKGSNLMAWCRSFGERLKEGA
jgi:hypothetical protein